MSYPFVLQAGQARHEVRQPHQMDVQITGTNDEILRQGGFFVPVKTFDEVKSSWQFRWDHVSKTELDALEAASFYAEMSLDTPLGFPVTGYIESLESDGVVGKVDRDTGEALFSVSMEFQVISMSFTGYLRPFPTVGTVAHDTELGVPADGVAVALLKHNYGSDGLTDALNRYLRFYGGNVNAWHDVQPPTGDQWNRTPRTLGSPRVYSNPEDHGNHIEVDARQLSRGKGSVFVAFKSLNSTVIEPLDDTLTLSSDLWSISQA